MLFLKQSTAITIKLGPFLDSVDGVSAKVSLTLSQADFRLSKNGGDFAQKNESSSATHDELGYYDVSIDATDTNTLGRLKVAVSESGALPVWQEFMVVPANVWDSLFGADKLQVHADEITAGLITATAIASDAITAAKLAADVTTEIQSGLLTSTAFDTKIGTPAGASLAADVAAVKSDTASIQSDTNDLQTQVGTAGAGLTAVASATNLATLTGYVDTEVAAIKAVTDNLPDSGALTTITNNVAAILADTSTDGVVVASGSKSGYSLSADQSSVTVGTVNALGAQAKADVNAEVLDVLDVDTFAEPTSAPAATSSLRAKIGWLFKLARNKFTQTSTTATLYADDGSTADNTSTTSDNGSTFSRGEWS